MAKVKLIYDFYSEIRWINFADIDSIYNDYKGLKLYEILN